MTTGRIELGPNGRAVAANVKRLRAARGMSLRALSEALSKAGRALSQDAINKIENGAEEATKKQIRRVDVDDLIALAVVLGVSPSSLLMPVDSAGRVPPEVEITAAGVVPGNLAWGWADGYCPLVHPSDDPDGSKWMEYSLNSRPRQWDPTRNVGLKKGFAQRQRAFDEYFQALEQSEEDDG